MVDIDSLSAAGIILLSSGSKTLAVVRIEFPNLQDMFSKFSSYSIPHPTEYLLIHCNLTSFAFGKPWIRVQSKRRSLQSGILVPLLCGLITLNSIEVPFLPIPLPFF